MLYNSPIGGAVPYRSAGIKLSRLWLVWPLAMESVVVMMPGDTASRGETPCMSCL